MKTTILLLGFAGALGCNGGDDGAGRPVLPESVELACTPSTGILVSGVVGLSDPNALDVGVTDLIAESGSDWARVEFHWSRIESEPGAAYAFDEYDAMVERLRGDNINVLAVLSYVPPAFERDWERIEDGFASFTAAVVERYAPLGVDYWEVFNEPNLTGYGWLRADEDAYINLPHYTRLLGIANETIRAIDTDAVIVLGGIASEQHRGLSVEETMDVLYGYGAAACFDIFAFHPYGYQNDFPRARARVQDVLDAHGDASKPVWFNEYGWTDQASMDMSVNDTVETNPMMAAFAQKDVADAFFWFSAKDYSSRFDAPTFGLADFNLNRRASFDTFQLLVAEE